MTKNDKQNIKLEKVDDKTAYENLLIKYAELESKIADIKANCDLAIEGRDVKIKELTVENADLKKEIEKHKWNDIFLEDCAGYDKKIAEEYTTLQERIEKLEQQIEKMKCCQNCKHCAKIPDYDLDNEEDNNIEFCEVRCHEKSGWELKE